ncbi:methyltransferase domain-containing protein [Salinibius halmophilus]|uniref:methyltransferase domain-containing protein n=1 Tax=Salinibius halmophilus TaxID=1853216 RepID=UPI000E67344B|nr:methyltransferase domain-containing protein [Salinibius halmophilus]
MNKTAQQFERAAEHYHEHAVIQQWVRDDMLAQLGATQGLWLDVGCGPQVQALGDDCIGIDLAYYRGSTRVQACTEAIPLQNKSVHGIFSNMALQWCEQPLNAIDEWARVCKLGAKIACSVTCAGNFAELVHAYNKVGLPCPVQPTLPATAWVSLFGAKFSLIHHHVHSYQLQFDNIRDLMQHIKETGANAPTQDSGIRSQTALERLENSMQRTETGKLPLTYKVVSLTAIKSYD